MKSLIIFSLFQIRPIDVREGEKIIKYRLQLTAADTQVKRN